jgi:hypothetical protein
MFLTPFLLECTPGGSLSYAVGILLQNALYQGYPLVRLE